MLIAPHHWEILKFSYTIDYITGSVVFYRAGLTPFPWRRISQSEIRNLAAEKRGRSDGAGTEPNTLRSREPGLNRRPHSYQECALPTELSRPTNQCGFRLVKFSWHVVWAGQDSNLRSRMGARFTV